MKWPSTKARIAAATALTAIFTLAGADPQVASGLVPTPTAGAGGTEQDASATAKATAVSKKDTQLDLPRIPWEGGPAYWAQFPQARRGGWTDPSFFPIGLWFGNFSTNAEVQHDKKLGFNTYVGMWEGTPFNLFKHNKVYWIGDALNTSFDEKSPYWVGDFLDDEVDGRYTPEDGRDYLQSIVDDHAGDGRFQYANYTQMVMSRDMRDSDAEAYVNDFTDAVSLDMYWYTIPYCDLTPYRDVYLTPVHQANCRTASSYGKTMTSLRKRDAADGHRQALWQYVEILNGGPGEGPFLGHIQPGEVRGAVMNSIINEARGIMYFNQSMFGPCMSGNVVRQAQVVPNFCGRRQVAAAGKVNNQIHRLARVINTQSYRYRFGRGLDTMLKSRGKYVYVFAMINGSSQPGSRRFTLPEGISGRSAKVMFEGRRVPITETRKFTDSFQHEYSYHVYRIRR